MSLGWLCIRRCVHCRKDSVVSVIIIIVNKVERGGVDNIKRKRRTNRKRPTTQLQFQLFSKNASEYRSTRLTNTYQFIRATNHTVRNGQVVIKTSVARSNDTRFMYLVAAELKVFVLIESIITLSWLVGWDHGL